MNIVKEYIDFEHGENPKDSLKIGKSRYKQEGDEEFGKYFLLRKTPEGNAYIVLNKLNGKEIRVGLYALKEVIKALKELV